jgi:hypothetical protein
MCALKEIIVFLKVFLWECFLGDVMFFKGLVVFLEEIYVLLREGDACVP